MSKLLRLLQTFIKQAQRSVAFLPVPMIAGAVLCGFVLFWLENGTGVSRATAETFPALAITSQDTARTILGMFIGGLITLTVFTFSQIMILLNQVAASYSPRLLPKLTGDRALQFVMGLNLSTIVLSITVLLSIRSSDTYRIPNFSILVCTVLGITCLCLFVYFVTAITKRIQVSSIVAATARDALAGLKQEHDFGQRGFGEREPPDDVGDWHRIPSPISGYVGSVSFGKLSSLAAELGTRLYIGVSKGEFVPEGLPLLQSERELNEEEIKRLLTTVSPIRQQFDDWYLPNLKQLTEIALKALSPGINDPGTALMVIDRQTEVLGLLLETPLHNYYRADDGAEIFMSRHGYPAILSALMQEMRTYAKEDPLVSRRLLQMLYHLLQLNPTNSADVAAIREEIDALLRGIQANLTDPLDRRIIADDLRFHRRTLHRINRSTALPAR